MGGGGGYDDGAIVTSLEVNRLSQGPRYWHSGEGPEPGLRFKVGS